MQQTIINIANYLLRGLLLTGKELLILFGPILFLAFLMHYISDFTRNTAARIIGNKPFLWLTALGTVIHELGHAVFCILFRHRITDICLFNPRGDGTLGYVNHSYNPRSIYQNVGNFFISTGPIWMGTALIYLMMKFLLKADVFTSLPSLSIDPYTVSSLSGLKTIGTEIWLTMWQVFRQLFQMSLWKDWKFYVFVFLAFNIGNHIKLSVSDLAGAWSGFVIIIFLLFFINLATQWKGNFLLIQCFDLASKFNFVYAIMLFVIVLNLAFFVFLLVLNLILKALCIV